MLSAARSVIDAPPWRNRRRHGSLPRCNLQTGNPRCTTSYSLACHHWSCGGPEINSLLQRKVLQNCLGRAAKSSGPGQEENSGRMF
uniref:Uncharacterized protein n=2 Tax=Felis catus TaxID=9685 RepID=A0ABI7XBR1_FELCA